MDFLQRLYKTAEVYTFFKNPICYILLLTTFRYRSGWDFSKLTVITNMKKYALLLSFSFLVLSPLLHADVSPFLQDKAQQLVIKNRILAKVNGKTISVLDVVKKMEVYFSRQYPQYANAPAAKFQYFSSQWKDVLLQMVDHELILADAEKLELKITDSEVRETLHDRFGPNLMGTLDSLGLSYEEAKDMIHSELIVQKMTWFKIHAKAINDVNVQDIKSAYTAYCQKNPPKELWEYQVLSVKAPSEEIAHQIADKAFELCKQSPSNIENISDRIKASFEPGSPEQDFTITLSEEMKLDTKSISAAHKDVLLNLAKNSISAPVKQFSRADQNAVFRIFHLKDHTKTVLPTLRSMYDRLQSQLVQEAADKESRIYIAKLREKFGFDAHMLEETIPSDFQPFSMQ